MTNRIGKPREGKLNICFLQHRIFILGYCFYKQQFPTTGIFTVHNEFVRRGQRECDPPPFF